MGRPAAKTSGASRWTKNSRPDHRDHDDHWRGMAVAASERATQHAHATCPRNGCRRAFAARREPAIQALTR